MSYTQESVASWSGSISFPLTSSSTVRSHTPVEGRRNERTNKGLFSHPALAVPDGLLLNYVLDFAALAG